MGSDRETVLIPNAPILHYSNIFPEEFFYV